MTRPREDGRLMDSLRDYIDAYAAYRVAAGYESGPETVVSVLNRDEITRRKAQVREAEDLYLERLENFVEELITTHIQAHGRSHIVNRLSDPTDIS